MLMFFGGFFYGIIFLGMLIYCLFLTATAYTKNIGELPGKEDDTYGMVLASLSLLGIFRSLLWIVVAFLWPFSLTILRILVSWEKSHDGLPDWLGSCAIWTFLCFGKFAPQEQRLE